MIGASAAVADAVADAVRPLGAELTDLPYSSVRIFEAVEAGLSHLRGAPH